MKVENKSADLIQEHGETGVSNETGPAHLAFRQIVIHEVSEPIGAQPIRLHFHYREHSKHIRQTSH